jgi:hypothetical protein
MFPSASGRTPLAAAPPNAGTQMAQNQEPVPEFADSSDPLFNMYCTKEKDYKSAEFLRSAAETLILFVRTSSLLFPYHFENRLDITVGLVFRYRCNCACGDISGPLARPAGKGYILP